MPASPPDRHDEMTLEPLSPTRAFRPQRRQRRMLNGATACPRSTQSDAHVTRPPQRKASPSSPRWRRRAEAGAKRSCAATHSTSHLGGAVLSCAEPLWSTPCRDGSCRLRPSTGDWQRMSWSISARPPPQGAIAASTTCRSFWPSPRARRRAGGHECYAEIYTRDRHLGASMRRWPWTRPGQDRPATSRSSTRCRSAPTAAGLRSGFMAGDPALVAMTLRCAPMAAPRFPFPSRRRRRRCGARTHPSDCEWYARLPLAEQIGTTASVLQPVGAFPVADGGDG